MTEEQLRRKMLSFSDAVITRGRHCAVSYNAKGRELKLNVINLHPQEAAVLATECKTLWTHKNNSYYLVRLTTTSQSILVPLVVLRMAFGADDQEACNAWLATAPEVTQCQNSICRFCYLPSGAVNGDEKRLYMDENKQMRHCDKNILVDHPAQEFLVTNETEFLCSDKAQIVMCPSCDAMYGDRHLSGCHIVTTQVNDLYDSLFCSLYAENLACVGCDKLKL